MDGAANSRVRAAAADISRHRAIEILVAGIGIRFQQCRRAHHLSGMAVSALVHFCFNPGALNRMAAVSIGRNPDLQDSDHARFLIHCDTKSVSSGPALVLIFLAQAGRQPQHQLHAFDLI
jgi:hypothetical protein